MMMITPGIGRPCQQDVKRRSGPADDGKDGGSHQGDHDHDDHDGHDDHVDDDHDDQRWGTAIKCDYFKSTYHDHYGAAAAESWNLEVSKTVFSSLQVEDDGTAIAEAVRNVMDLTFDPIGKQPFFVGMTKMCHQVRSLMILIIAISNDNDSSDGNGS